jgi:hypothetical protein
MDKVTRRKFLQGASVGAAAVGVLAVGPGLMANRSSDHGGEMKSASRATAAPGAVGAARQTTDARATTGANEPVMAYVRDAAKGEVVIFAGTREITRNDPDLAARLLHATA